MAYERTAVRQWIAGEFAVGWADEFELTLNNHPTTTLLAVQHTTLLGFASYEATAPGFFGPTGVTPAHRGAGIGAALLIEAMHRLRGLGYVYGIIGRAGPVDFFQQQIDAMPIPNSDPGIYANRVSLPPPTNQR
jgi:GNAT superfamily N-acetyltransferase